MTTRLQARARPFAPGDLSWTVNREAVLLLGGGRALLLQLAHPLVAAGVADHSDFLRAPIARLRRTLDATWAIVFGDAETAQAAARAVRAGHARVRGVLREGTAAFPAGTPYDARDPDLLLWVHATLVESTFAAYQSFVRPLGARERARLYADSRWTGTMFGVPESRLPPDLDAFSCYMRDMIESRTLEVTPTARRLGEAVLRPPLPLVPGRLFDPASVLTLGLLPPAVRARYGFAWGPGRARAFRAARALVRTALPWLPDAARAVPMARRAEATAGRECGADPARAATPR